MKRKLPAQSTYKKFFPEKFTKKNSFNLIKLIFFTKKFHKNFSKH